MTDEKLDAEKIKLVLKRLHMHEAGGLKSRVEAYKSAISGSGLNHAERLILLRAINVAPSEVGENP